MKTRTLLFIACWLLSLPALSQQSAVSKPVNVTVNVQDYVNYYVLPKVRAWQEKGETEKTAAYEQRVTLQNRETLVKELEKEAIEAYKKIIISQTDWEQFQLMGYDADNETAKVRSVQFGDITVSVSPSDYPAFKQNFSSLKKTKQDFYFVDNQAKLAEITFVAASGGQYRYDSQNPGIYEPPHITIDLGDPKTGRIGEEKERSSGVGISKEVVITARSDVDLNIPAGEKHNNNTYAVIIGNEHYRKEPHTRFSAADAATFYQYATKTLGIPSENIYKKQAVIDATYGDMQDAIAFLSKAAKAKNGNIKIIIYFSGHGMADIENRKGYLLPIDGSSETLRRTALKTEDLYKELAAMNVLSATVFLDACFGGASNDGALVAMQGVKALQITPKEDVPQGNIVVFSATAEAQTAYTYNEKGHGIFTYFLLKKLQATQGKISYGKLSEYLTNEVKSSAFDINKKVQTPKVLYSPILGNKWENWTFSE